MNNYTLIPRFILLDDDIGDMAFRVYCLLTDYAFRNVYAFPSIETMAEALNKSMPTIKRGVKELREKGLIRIFREHERATNTYVLIPYEWRNKFQDNGYIKTKEEFEKLVADVRAYYEEQGRSTVSSRRSGYSYMKSAKEKLERGEFKFNVNELVAVFKILNQEVRNHVVNTNYKRDIPAIKTIFGDKKEYGEYEFRILLKYVSVYDNLFKSPKYPHPSLWNLGVEWIYDKVKKLVDRDIAEERREDDELSDLVF